MSIYGKQYNKGFTRYYAGGYTPDPVEDPFAGRSSGKGKEPVDTLPVQKPDFSAYTENDGLIVTWFGHSSLLLRFGGLTILLDPVLRPYVAPLPFVGPHRFSPLPCTASELPDIDVCIISHDHYDHLNDPTLLKLRKRIRLFLTSKGVASHLRHDGLILQAKKELTYWERITVGEVTFCCAPCFHNAGRPPFNKDTRLWASWVMEAGGKRLYFSGDSGFSGHFAEIREHCGPMDFALLDSSQFHVNWPGCHMFPEQSVQAAQILEAGLAMPIHAAAFALSEHPWDDPLERFSLRADEVGLDWISPYLGETVRLGKLPADREQIQRCQTRWWRNYR